MLYIPLRRLTIPIVVVLCEWQTVPVVYVCMHPLEGYYALFVVSNSLGDI